MKVEKFRPPSSSMLWWGAYITRFLTVGCGFQGSASPSAPAISSSCAGRPVTTEFRAPLSIIFAAPSTHVWFS